MFEKQLDRIKNGEGFIAALDQSGGSTPKALLGYGVSEDKYKNDEEMFDLIHQMRTRVITDKSFTGDKILGVILFEKTLYSSIKSTPTAEFLWNKNIVPFLKIDKGMEDQENGVKLMKDMPNLSDRLKDAKGKGVYGTKMRSVIYENNPKGIEAIVRQQFEIARKVLAQGLIPIIEPEVDIKATEKQQIEKTLKKEILAQLEALDADQKILLKLTLPTQDNLYSDLVQHNKVLRVFALSGGYSLEKATELLAKNNGMIASFSRALLGNLRVDQSPDEFSDALSSAIESIYKASIT